MTFSIMVAKAPRCKVGDHRHACMQWRDSQATAMARRKSLMGAGRWHMRASTASAPSWMWVWPRLRCSCRPPLCASAPWPPSGPPALLLHLECQQVEKLFC